MAESQVLDAIEENLPDEEESEEWNWEALAKFGNTRWGLNLRDRDLKKVGREGVGELLIERAREAIERVDLAEAAVMLQEDFGLQTTLGWVRHKFGHRADSGGDPRPGTGGDEEADRAARRRGL